MTTIKSVLVTLAFFFSACLQLFAWNSPTISSPADGALVWTGITCDWSAVSLSQQYQFQADTSASFNSPVKVNIVSNYINSSSANSDTQWFLDNLFFGKTYYWRVRAYISGDTSAWVQRSFTTRDYVTMSSPATGSTTWASTTLNWAPHTGVDYYDVEADTSINFNSPAKRNTTTAYINSTDGNSDTQWFLDDIYFAKKYYWRVRARNTVDTSTWSGPWYFTTNDYVTMTSPATGSSVWAGVTLDWVPHPGVDFYDVEADTSLTFSSPALKTASKSYVNSTDGNSDTYHYLTQIYFGTKYYWRVRARNAVDTSSWSSPWNFTTRDYITMVSPGTGSSTWAAVTMEWSPHPGVDYYMAEADTSLSFNSPAKRTISNAYINSSDGNSDTYFYAEDLFFGKTYYWRVRARNGVDTTQWTTFWTFTTRDYVTMSSPATGSTVWSGITLDWLPHNGVDFYDVEADTSVSFNSLALKFASKNYINSTEGNSDTYHYLTQILFGTKYYWRVRARNAVDTTSWSSPWNFTTRDYVTQTSPAIGSSTWAAVTMDWSPHPGVDFYMAEADTSPNFNSPAKRTISNSYINSSDGNSDTYFYAEDLYFGTKYYWRVRGRNSADTCSWSPVWNFTTRDYVTMSSPATGSSVWAGLTLNWAPHNGVDYYDAEADTSASFNSPAKRTVSNGYINSTDGNTDTQWFLDDIYFGKKYYWRVRARNAVDSSTWTASWNFTTRDYVTLSSPTDGQTGISVGGVTLNWTPHTGVDIYNLQWDTVNLFNSPFLKNITKGYINSTDGNSDTQDPTGALLANHIYFWRVRAINAVDSCAWTARAFTTGSTPIVYPSVPVLVSPPNGSQNSSGSVTLTWQASANATSYEYLISLDPNFLGATITANTNTSVTISGLVFGTYYWKVRALKGTNMYSNWSETWSFHQCTATTNSITQSSCDSYTLNGQTYSGSGTFIQTLTNHLGCDSTITLNLTIKQSSSKTINDAACETYTLNGQTYTTSGTYTQTLINHLGCDSTITLNLVVKHNSNAVFNHVACDSYTFNGQTYTGSGTFTQTITNMTGCDSVITLNLTVRNSSAAALTQSACDSYTLNGFTYTGTGTYYQTLTNHEGCDSTITLHVTIKQSTGKTINQTACENYTLNGQNYTASGTYTQYLTNSVGCDSVITLNLVVKHNSSTTLTQTTCDTYNLNGQNYSSSGTFTQTIQNMAGCDSVITLHLTIHQSAASSVTDTACDSYLLNGQTYSTNGTFIQHLTNHDGCDSVLTLHLTLKQSTVKIINASACNSYTLNGQTYTSNGTFTQTIPNSVGCDSIITIHLTINTVETSVTQNGALLSSNAAGAIYQWLDCNNSFSPIANATGQSYIPTSNGNYAVAVTQNSCTDTSACYSVVVTAATENIGRGPIEIFPNPSDGIFTLRVPAESSLTVVITDLAGRIVFETTGFETFDTRLDLSFLENGTYYLVVGNKEKKIIPLVILK